MALNDKDKTGFFGRHRWLVVSLGVGTGGHPPRFVRSIREEAIPVRAVDG